MFQRLVDWIMFPYANDKNTVDESYYYAQGSPSKNGRIILVAHGNNEVVSEIHEKIDRIAELASCHVLAYEYPGNAELASEATMNAYNFILNSLMFQPADVIFMGFGIGTGIVLEFICRHAISPQSIILCSPFTTIMDLSMTYPLCGLQTILSYAVREPYDNIKRVSQLHPSVSLLIIHDPHDPEIPFSMAESLFRTSPAKKKMLHPGCICKKIKEFV